MSQVAAQHAHDEEHEHEHVIVPLITLRMVLVILVALTVLTSGAAYLEEFIAYTFGIVFPQWVNVIVAMSIACIKTTIVVLFFMQLKYDNPLNAAVLIFTFICVILFLGFTMIDVGNRGTVDRIKAPEVQVGGFGYGNGAVAVAARADAMLNNPSKVHLHHHHEPDSSASHARPVTGITLEEFMDEDDHGHDDHGHGHGHGDGH